ncbi:trimeric intracellular cation channel type B-B-like isoform X1 [Pristis pectinata]|uniref:trimeric intracellular cation channel type B-B-like isoform X1 n=1 Tax=Pristis pectinata TaxID=685728 RepID=UPI00223D15BB|nr:trimeric intracellular cation channel type B-B-like isoform X1 [Pristis pectinata]
MRTFRLPAFRLGCGVRAPPLARRLLPQSADSLPQLSPPAGPGPGPGPRPLASQPRPTSDTLLVSSGIIACNPTPGGCLARFILSSSAKQLSVNFHTSGVNGRDGHRVDVGAEQFRRAVLADFHVPVLRHGPLHALHHEPEGAARYLIFYCPYDKFYKCCNFLPSKLFIAGMKEVTRARKIVGGVVDAHSRYRNGWLAVIAVGWAKGAGSGLISNFEQLVRGVWMPERNELLKMSYATKVTLIGAVLFTLQQMNYLPITRHNLIFLYTMFVVSTKVAMVLFNIHHSPFAPMEVALYHMAFSWQSSSSEDHFKTEASNKEELQGKKCPAPSGIPSEETENIKRKKAKKSE